MSKLCIINTIKTKIRGNATSYIERENEIFIPKSDRFTLEQTYKIAVKKVDKINQEYLSEKFGKVVSLNTSASNGTGIKIHPSQLLIDAYEVKEGNKSIEELNPRNLDYFNGDEALLEQEQREFNFDEKEFNFDRIKLVSYFIDKGYQNINENNFTRIFNDYQKFLFENPQFDIDDFIKLIENNEYSIQSDLNSFIDESNKIGEQIRDVEDNIQFSLSPEINYQLKAIEILNSQKGKQVFEKGQKNNWSLDKILTELQIPKEQKQLIFDSGKTNLDDIITDLLANYSYTIEINTGKDNLKPIVRQENITKEIFESIDVEPEFDGDPESYSYIKETPEAIYYATFNSEGEEYYTKSIKGEQNNNSSHYSNLTVPGGTNGSYREQNFETPLIKVPKSHAQFNTENTIGFSRNDDRQIYTEKDVNSLLEVMQKSGILEIKC